MGPSSLSLRALHTTHVLTHTDAQCDGISRLDRRKECILRPAIARKLIQPGSIPRARHPWCHPDQIPHPVTSDQPPSRLALLPEPSSLGAECTLARLRGQGVKGPREERRKEGPLPSTTTPLRPILWDHNTLAKAVWRQKLCSPHPRNG